VRPLFLVAEEIEKDWIDITEDCKYYIECMKELKRINNRQGFDSGKTFVVYFLAECILWHTSNSRKLKKELEEMIK